jgi:hypothetical protein
VWAKYGELMMHGNDETDIITKTYLTNSADLENEANVR